GSPFYVSSMATTQSPLNSTPGYFYDPSTLHHGFGADKGNVCCSPSTIMPPEPPMLVASSSSTTTTSTMSSSSVDYLNETIAKASSLPDSFYPEFLQYSKETYEQSTNGQALHRKKQRKIPGELKEDCNDDSEKDDEDDDNEDEGGDIKGLSSTEMRRQIHIQSEQKRRAQIKDGFEDLRNELPACLNKKMSKVALLHRTVQHIQHLKDNQMSILSDLERLVIENEQLRKFQETVLQKQAMENIYSMGPM
ncbi:hypothetical protein BDF14DRAFT_1717667, partial [Spinellus fusiger]